MQSVIVHYQEIALKGRTARGSWRGWCATCARRLSDLDVKAVRVLMGRIEIVLGAAADWSVVRDRLSRVFGIGNFAKAGRAALEVEAIAAAILDDLGDMTTSTFRLSARRADKRFPLTSPEIEREVGGRIKEARNWTVNLSHPELTIHVEALTDEAFYFFGKDRGPGGLPVGSSGRVVCLLSGGIDSPVAAWRMMRRGCRVLFVHFHSYPVLSRASQEKARELVANLTRFQSSSRLMLVPFGELQQQVILTVPPPLRVVIYRRLMMRIAERIAQREPRAGAGHRRGGRPGRVADAREHDAHHRGGRRCRYCGRSSAWTRRRSPRRRSASAPTRSRSSRTRTAARSSRRKHPATKARQARGRTRGIDAAGRRDDRAGDRRRGAGGLFVPVIEWPLT